MNKDRNPKILWPVLKNKAENDPDFAGKLKIRLIGPVDHQIFDSIEEIGLTQYLEHIPYKGHKEVIEDLIDSAIQLLPINNTANLMGVVPGKLYEYIGSRRPILCVGTKEGDAAKIIMETNSGVVIDYDESELLSKTIDDWFDQFKSKDLMVESSDFDKFSRKVLAGNISDYLNKISNS